MPELLKSISEWFKEKTTSPLLATFILYFLLWNWKIFYFLFWQDQTALLRPKIFSVDYFYDKFDFAIFNWLYSVVTPIIATYLVIVYFPKLNHWAYKISISNLFQRKGYYRDSELKYQELKNIKLGKLVEAKEEQKKVEEKLQAVLSEEDKWDLEYEKAESVALINALKNAEDIIYGFNGWFSRKFDESGDRKILDPNQLALLDLWGLVDIDGDRVSFTLKGKHFLKRIKTEDETLNSVDNYV